MAWWKWSNDQDSDSAPPPPNPGQQGPPQPAPPEHSAEWWRFDDPELSSRGPETGPAPISAWIRPGDEPDANGQPQPGGAQAAQPGPPPAPYGTQPPAEFAGQPAPSQNGPATGPQPGAPEAASYDAAQNDAPQYDAAQYDTVGGADYTSSGQFARPDEPVEPPASDYPASEGEAAAPVDYAAAPDGADDGASTNVDTDHTAMIPRITDAEGAATPDQISTDVDEPIATDPVDSADSTDTTELSDNAPAESDPESSPSGGLSDDSPAATPDNSSTTAPDALVTTPPTKAPTKDGSMADYQTSLNDCMQIEGALGVALVETNSGMALATAGNPPTIDLNVAAAGNSTVVQAKLRTMRELGLNEKIEDILITLDSQYHIVRPLGVEDGVFIYLVLDKERGNLAMARFRLAKIERDFSF